VPDWDRVGNAAPERYLGTVTKNRSTTAFVGCVVIAAFLALPAMAHSYKKLCYPGVTIPAITIPAMTIPAITIPAITIPATTIPAFCVGGTCYPAQHYPAQHYSAQHYPAQHYPAQHYSAQHYPGACFSTTSTFAPTRTTVRVRNYVSVDSQFSPQRTSSYWTNVGPTVSYPNVSASGFGGYNAAGFPKNQYVRSYVRRDGTFISGYWRNSPTDGLPTCRIIRC
jgi:hypothetical protein